MKNRLVSIENECQKKYRMQMIYDALQNPWKVTRVAAAAARVSDSIRIFESRSVKLRFEDGMTMNIRKHNLFP